MEEESNNYTAEDVLLLLHGYRKKLLRKMSRGKDVAPDVEDAVSEAIVKFAEGLGGKIALNKSKEEYLRLFTTVAKNKLLDIRKRGIGNQKKEDKTISSQTREPIDLRHRAKNRIPISSIDELVSDQDLFKEATKKDTAHVVETLAGDVMETSSEAANNVLRKLHELLVTKQENVTQAELAKECHVSRASISYTFSKVRRDVTKRRPDILETYVVLFAV